MRRASLDRQRTIREWRSRLEMDDALEPGRFRKGRTARGCPRRCTHCRAKKLEPTLQTVRSDLSFREWLRTILD
jgi:hypothetical protein